MLFKIANYRLPIVIQKQILAFNELNPKLHEQEGIITVLTFKGTCISFSACGGFVFFLHVVFMYIWRLNCKL
jgi:hypothetical protein